MWLLRRVPRSAGHAAPPAAGIHATTPYYGLKAFTYLAGEGRWQDLGFKFVFCLFVIVGAGINLGALTDLSDALVFVVAIPNLVGLYLMAPIVRRELARYRPPA